MSNTTEHEVDSTAKSVGRPPFWISTTTITAAIAVLGIVAVLGYSTARCRDVAGTLLWSAFIIVAPAIGVATDSPAQFAMGACAVVGCAALLALLRFRVTWARFAIAVFGVYAVVTIVAWIAGVQDSCRIM